MQQQAGGGSQFGLPSHVMASDHLLHRHPAVEAAEPISSCPLPPPQSMNLAEFSGVDEDIVGGDGEEAGRQGGGGSRWPRQETLALLKIRSEMDAAFRDATLKGPLWEDVSRRMASLGFTRSAKKCKEKFENVHKYYKRTKEGRAGRQDGKSYRFCSQLEALENITTQAAAVVSSALISSHETAVPYPPALPSSALSRPPPEITPNAAGMTGFSSNTSSSSSSEFDFKEGEEVGRPNKEGRKRRRGGWPCARGKVMAFFEGLVKQVMERQEAMQQLLLETLEKREQERMVKEEAWKRQEMARLAREYELMSQERAMAASRDAAVISFLQKLTAGGHPPPPPPPPQQQSPPEPVQQEKQRTEPEEHEVAEIAVSGGLLEPASPVSSRWPKVEVHALIRLRSGLDEKYDESGSKGPLWEEISMRMQRLGYHRSAKRCKEKWENINKYFRKVKESNKKRPEDAKTCPYFHQLDTLYRKKQLDGASAAEANPIVHRHQEQAPLQQTEQGRNSDNPTTMAAGCIGNGSRQNPAVESRNTQITGDWIG
ncbi:hypothetical protein HPP92_022711 [Vanilla planifolia]|uniref:Myb-like domain-containing protein n=1 Tax=Vanilla planifolia TaxID=51239 RepID=A0A835UC64_VANPL|nr:hypothetical protein HPP92_022711 [Vanilla planifolia]